MINQVYIFGAHSRGRTLKKYLETIYSDIEVRAFLVDSLEDNRENIDGVPVIAVDGSINNKLPVYIGTRGVYHEKISEKLSSLGVGEIIPVTVELDRELRNKFVKIHYDERGKEFEFINDYQNNNRWQSEAINGEAVIYVASSIFDAELTDKYTYLPDEKKIQVGTSLTDQRISQCEFYDNSGDNISDKNKQFCELTALYWIWKNSVDDIVGLVHYRRHFLLPENWKNIVNQECIDVVLPVPLYVCPSLEVNYKERHTAADWECMMDILGQKNPEMYDAAKEFFSDGLYSPCNMLIAKKEVFDELCAWMFPIIFEVEKICGTHEDSYQNRYPGFISERLISFYFDYFRDKYKVVYADKNFLR